MYRGRIADEQIIEARINKAATAWYHRRRRDQAAAHAELHSGGPAYKQEAPYPRFVVQGDFEDGRAVYRNWPHMNFKGIDLPEIYIIDSLTDAIFAGYLRGTPGKFWLEEWGTLAKRSKDKAEIRALSTQIREFMGATVSS